MSLDFADNLVCYVAPFTGAWIEIAELMGHTDTATTMQYYVGLTEKMIDQAKNILNSGQNSGQIQGNKKSG